MAAIKLVAMDVFESGGVRYIPGAVITEDQLANWPAGALQTRLDRGSVSHQAVEEETPVTSEEVITSTESVVVTEEKVEAKPAKTPK